MTAPTAPLLGEFEPLPRTPEPSPEVAPVSKPAVPVVDDGQARRIADLERQVRGLQSRPQPAPAPVVEPEPEKRSWWGAGVDAWSLRAALAATIVLTASGEYSLACLAGWPAVIAWALPVSLDVYVIQAMRRGRDVFLALLLMVATNAVYHLAERGLFGVLLRHGQPVLHEGQPRPEWWLIVGVAAIAPWVMLRIHHIGHRADAGESSATVPAETPDASGERFTEPSQGSAATPAETAPESPAETPTPTPATARETPPETRRATPKRPRRKASAAKGNAPSQLMPKEEQLEVVQRVVQQHEGDDDPPLQTIADALGGCSKATASRRLAELKLQSA